MSGIIQKKSTPSGIASPVAGSVFMGIDDSGVFYTKNDSGTVTTYPTTSGGGSFTGGTVSFLSATTLSSTTLNVDFTDTLEFFTDDNFNVPFGSAYFGPPLNWVDLTISGDFMGAALNKTNHSLYSFVGDGQSNIPSLGLSFPADVTGNILTVTSGSMSGSTLIDVITFTDQSGLGGPQQYSKQTNMVYVDPVGGDKTQFSFNQNFDTTVAGMGLSRQNNEGEVIELIIDTNTEGFLFSSGLSDLDARIFDISNSNSDKVLEVTGSNIASDTILAHDYVDDAAAALGGVPVGGFYHTSGALKIRTV